MPEKRTSAGADVTMPASILSSRYQLQCCQDLVRGYEEQLSTLRRECQRRKRRRRRARTAKARYIPDSFVTYTVSEPPASATTRSVLESKAMSASVRLSIF